MKIFKKVTAVICLSSMLLSSVPLSQEILPYYFISAHAIQGDANSTEKKSGWQTVDGKTSYFQANGEKAVGIVTIKGKTYYFDKNGVQCNGWQKIDDKEYYFNNADAGEAFLVGYWNKENDGWHFKTPEGKNFTGLKAIGDKKYYFSESGVQKTGWQTVDGKTCLFNKGEAKEGYLYGNWTVVKSHYVFKKTDKTKLTGVVTLAGKKYYFNSKGYQRTGWQKIKGEYYFFKIANGKNGYMIKNKKINGVKLLSDGKAEKSSASLQKLKVLINANTLYQKLTKPTPSKEKRLHICFDYIRDNLKYCTPRQFSPKGHWEYEYAQDIFVRGKGNCFSCGCAFAFLASACGYKNVNAVSSGGHGWAEIDGLVYDPDWAIASKVDDYFAMSYDLSGVKGRPNYKKYRAYVAKI